MNILTTYLILISPLTLVLGFWIGIRYERNRQEYRNRLAFLKQEQEKINKLGEKLDNLLPSQLRKMEFNIIGIKLNKESVPLTLEDELKEALSKEDYERAAEIKKKIDNKN
tara:strand:+ start:616 stop:948 length:333 start_codon:yes stop_codon:yes gene_type:complete